MSRYRFAHLFVRLSRALGVVLLICGLAFAAYRFVIQNSQADAARYRKNAEVDLLLSKVESEAERAVRILGNTISEMGDTSDGSPFSPLPKGLETVAQYTKLSDMLAAYKVKTNAIKAATVLAFERGVEGIRLKLIKHAEAIAGQKVTIQSRTGSEQQKSSGSNVIASETEHLFTYLTNEARRTRANALADVWNYLEGLEKASEQPENKEVIKNTNARLVWLMSLIPSPVEITQRRAVREEATVNVRENVKAEQIADVLKQAIRVVHENVLESWKLDDAIDQATTKSLTEKDRCEIATHTARMFRIQGWEETFLYAIATLIASFLVLVMADFLQTQLDIANNTARLYSE